MACLILRSCTIGDTTVLVTNALLSPTLIAPIDYRGQHIKLQGHGVTCFSVEEIADGICDCPNNTCTLNKSTSGKGSGDGIGQCKKVTIAIFESGNVVITGGRNINHANSAYNFINVIIINDAKYFASVNISDIC